MKKMKRILGVVVATVTVLSMSAVAFAGSNSKVVTGYGTLYGNVYTYAVGGPKVITVTSVTTNPDNAYLKTKIELQDYMGNTQITYEAEQTRGATSFPHNFDVPHFDDVAKVYGAHNVQGGGTYAAQVVYTSTEDIVDY